MNLIDRHRRFFRDRLLPCLDPFFVVPVETGNICSDRSGAGTELCAEGKRIRLVENLPLLSRNREFVQFTCAKARDKELVNAGIFERFHRSSLGIPGIEVADHADCPGMGRPDGEIHAGLPSQGLWVCAELPIDIIVGPLPKEIPVKFCDKVGRSGYFFSGNRCLIICAFHGYSSRSR